MQFKTIFGAVFGRFLIVFWVWKMRKSVGGFAYFWVSGLPRWDAIFDRFWGGPGPRFGTFLAVKKRSWPKKSDFRGDFFGPKNEVRKSSEKVRKVKKNTAQVAAVGGGGSAPWGGTCPINELTQLRTASGWRARFSYTCSVFSQTCSTGLYDHGK